jgi:hypothetical protein
MLFLLIPFFKASYEKHQQWNRPDSQPEKKRKQTSIVGRRYLKKSGKLPNGKYAVNDKIAGIEKQPAYPSPHVADCEDAIPVHVRNE